MKEATNDELDQLIERLESSSRSRRNLVYSEINSGRTAKDVGRQLGLSRDTISTIYTEQAFLVEGDPILVKYVKANGDLRPVSLLWSRGYEVHPPGDMSERPMYGDRGLRGKVSTRKREKS